MVILGIETSCDETAVALLRNRRETLASLVGRQEEIHAPYGGVVPELASRRHLEVISPLFEKCLARAGLEPADIDAVAASTRPGLSGSLIVGEGFGRALAGALEKPFIPVDHLEAHLAVNFLAEKEPALPALGLVISGGHSSIYLVHAPDSYEVLGETRDDAAGETFDKVARSLGLPYPGGPPLEKLAAGAGENRVRFPLPGVARSFDFSFSGLKTAVVYHVAKNPGADRAAVAAGFQDAVAAGVRRHLEYARFNTGARTLLTGGGVLANARLRAEISAWAKEKKVSLYLPPPVNALDNALMVAARAFPEIGAKGREKIHEKQ